MLVSERGDRLFNDPWASTLAGPGCFAWLDQRSGDSVLPIVLRTRYFDDFLQRIVNENAIQQVVLMAAGLDTRAFRLAWPVGAPGSQVGFDIINSLTLISPLTQS